MTIPCYSTFIQLVYLLAMLEHDMNFGQVQVMEFPWHLLKNGGISIGFGLIFDQTAVKKTRENPCHIFNRAPFLILSYPEQLPNIFIIMGVN